MLPTPFIERASQGKRCFLAVMGQKASLKVCGVHSTTVSH